MTKLFSSDLHGNDNSGMAFGITLLDLLSRLRPAMLQLETSRKADEEAPGYLHALRKLCDGEPPQSVDVLDHEEIAEWQTLFFAWFERVKRHIPAKLVKRLHANATDDFRIIRAASNTGGSSESWREEAQKQYIRLEFPTKAALDQARDAADRKHPVALGSALFEYLERCLAELVDAPAPEPDEPTPPPASDLPPSLRPFFVWHDDQRISLCLTDFDAYTTAEDREQQNDYTAYDLEKAVKKYLTQHAPQAKKTLRFDCESSMFCVVAKEPKALAVVVEALLHLVNENTAT